MARFLHSSLIRQFAVVSLLAVTGIGLGLALIIGQVLEGHAIDDLAAEAQDAFHFFVAHHLTPADFDGPMGGPRLADFDQFVRENLLSTRRTVRIKLWNRDGVIIYSDEAGLIGQRFPVQGELEAALSGHTASHLSDLRQSENLAEAAYGRLLEVYSPVVFPPSPEVVGAFEMCQSYERVAHLIEATRRWAYAGLAGGLLFLYLALFAIVKRASDAILQYHRSLTALYETSQSIRSTLSTSDILPLVVRYAVTLVRGDCGWLLLRQEPDRELHTAAVYPSNGTTLPEFRLELSEATVTGRVALAGETCVAVDADYSAECPPTNLGAAPVRALLSVPLKIRESTIGVLNVATISPSRRFGAEESALVEQFAGAASLAIDQAHLMEETRQQRDELLTAYHSTLQALAVALELRDRETEGHSRRVSQLAVALGRRLGLSEEALRHLEQGAFLHDVGKIGISDTILLKPGPLTEDEWVEMRRHPVLGYQLLSTVPFLKEASVLVLNHHERFDGSGYPAGLTGEAIPLPARIFAVVDAYDALTSDRPYREARPQEEAVAELRRGAGTYFDPRVVEAFVEMLAEPLELAVKSAAGPA